MQKVERKKPPIVENPEFAELGKTEITDDVSEPVEVIGEITVPISEPVMTMMLDSLTDTGTSTAEEPQWTFCIGKKEEFPELRIRKSGAILIRLIELPPCGLHKFRICFDDTMKYCKIVQDDANGQKIKSAGFISYEMHIPQEYFKKLQVRTELPVSYRLNPETLIGELVVGGIQKELEVETNV